MGLERDPSCFSLTTWRCKLPEGIGVEALALALERRGFLRKSKPAPLVLLRRPDDTELVLGHRTHSLVIRVPLTVPEKDRPAFAETVFLRVLEALREGRAASDAS